MFILRVEVMSTVSFHSLFGNAIFITTKTTAKKCLITILLWPWTRDTKSHESCYLSITLMKPMDTVKVWLVFPIGKLPVHFKYIKPFFQWSVSSSLIICSSMWKNLICHSALKVNLPRPSGEIKLPIFWTKRPRRKMESQHDPWSSGFATLWASQGV